MHSQGIIALMRRLPAAALCCLAAGWWPAAQVCGQQSPYSRFIAQTDPLPPAEQQRKFHLPPGFSIELVAAEPQVRKPINLSFDASGRLLVSCSIEYPFPAPPSRRPRDVIRILSDTDGDGRYDRVQSLAERLNIPVGVAAIADGALAYSIPNIYWLADRDGDGRAEARHVLYSGFGFEDTHGMPNGFLWWMDGWVYAVHGEGNTSHSCGTDGHCVTLQGGNTFRLRPDGSRIELFAHGQANPFGLCFDPLGNLYTADSHSRPGYLLLRGAWYPGLGASHDGLGFGPPMMNHYHGSTGIAGIACWADERLPAAWRGSLLIGNPVTGRINCDRLDYHGSTVRAIEQPDFLRCDDPWFRPVDVKLGPDGAIYIADFYNRIIAHTLVPLGHALRDRQRGRIWRVFYGGDSRQPRPWPVPNLASAPLDELLDALGHPNLLVRTHATHQLVERFGRAAVVPVRELVARSGGRWQRASGLWVLARLDALDDRLIERLARDTDRAVRVHLMRALAELPNWQPPHEIRQRVAVEALADPDRLVRRAAADALGRHPSAAQIVPLLQLWADTPDQDTMLVHTARMALRNVLAAQPNLVQLAQRFGRQPDDARRLADVCLGIHTPASAAVVLRQLQRGGGDAEQLGRLLEHAARYADRTLLPEVLQLARSFQGRGSAAEATVLRAIDRAFRLRDQPMPPDMTRWAVQLAKGLLEQREERAIYEGIELAWDLQLQELVGPLARRATNAAEEIAIRSFAIDALVAIDPEGSRQLLARLMADAQQSLDVRQKAAEGLGKINTPESRQALDQQLAVAPFELARSIARSLAHSRAGAELLLTAVQQGKASARLLQDPLVDQALRTSRPADLERRLPALLGRLPPADERLEQLIRERQAGFAAAQTDVQRGAKVFEKHCANCHQLGTQGTEVGPRLDGIGQRGLRRILEDTLDPNQTVGASYRTSVLQLASGQVLTGLILSDQDGVVVIADAEGKTRSLAASQIDDRRLSPLSIMPADVAEKIPAAEFYDLVAFLLAQRTGPAQETRK